MPFRIQRTSRGVNDLLSIFGGETPGELEDRVRGVVDFLQFYGLQQQRVVTNTNAALTELTALDITNVTVGCQYAVLFGCSFLALKTATMTALRLEVLVLRNGNSGVPVVNIEGGPFGANETGNVAASFIAPYPMLLVPPWTIRGRMPILGTDANASCVTQAEIGVLS